MEKRERNSEASRAKNRRERSEENKQRGGVGEQTEGVGRERERAETFEQLTFCAHVRSSGLEERKRVHEEGVPVVDGCG